MTNEKSVREPLFHVAKRDALPTKKVLTIYLIAILIGLVSCGIVCAILFGANPFEVYGELIKGNFGSERRIWILLQDVSLLLLVSLALAPAFKMKFWNLGANGQILIGCLGCISMMFYFGGKLPDAIVWILMIIASVGAGILWAVIPAIFKSKWNTNESLFTLMMNYVAEGLVGYCISKWVKTGSGTLSPIENANLPEFGNRYVLIIIMAIIVTTFMYIYLKQSKHGFEVALVGESQNTAKYVGINVKKVFIRTLILSGAVCGIVGLLLGGSINHTISKTSANNMGFTAIMAVWFAKCNPLLMIASCFGIVFLSKGMKQVQLRFGVTNDAVADIVIGLVYFIIIGCEFFISYKLNKTKTKKRSGFLENTSAVKEDK